MTTKYDKLFCPLCDHDTSYNLISGKYEIEVKDLIIVINGTKAFCKLHSNEELHHPEYDQENQDLAFNEYRNTKGLLQPIEIAAIRNSYNLTQKDFSKLLGFGEITITRYENGSIQTKAQNNLIESTRDPKIMYKYFIQNKEKISPAEQHRLENYFKEIQFAKDQESIIINQVSNIFSHQKNSFNGYESFNLAKFEQIILFFTLTQKSYKPKLNKLLFYVDYYHYKVFKRSVTGTRYLKNHYGPVPEKYQTLYDNLKSIVWIENETGEYATSDSIFNSNLFTITEIATIEYVDYKFRKMNAREISELSHKEKGWKKTNLYQFIDYEFANTLSI
ncbi:MAG: type II TA system antitoxin MqsA family protein [Paenibacillus sp.]|uniref:type II TA system antitoxin MqsA family protein n=1 Tax=Paenibacillus sp. TaxID=58172 RepID=UPI003B7D2AF9